MKRIATLAASRRSRLVCENHSSLTLPEQNASLSFTKLSINKKCPQAVAIGALRSEGNRRTARLLYWTPIRIATLFPDAIRARVAFGSSRMGI